VKTSYCQKVEFNFWFGYSTDNYYHLSVHQNNDERLLYIRITRPNEKADILYSKAKKIEKTDCDTLWSFLDKYKFKSKAPCGNPIETKVYVYTQKLPDSVRYVVDGDTIRKQLLAWFNYTYDPDSNKCYRLEKDRDRCCIFDGWYYSGEYIVDGKRKAFRIPDSREDIQDYNLYALVYRIVEKYGRSMGKRYLSHFKSYLIPKVKAAK
jgi:hypothetical protein